MGSINFGGYWPRQVLSGVDPAKMEGVSVRDPAQMGSCTNGGDDSLLAQFRFPYLRYFFLILGQYN